MYGQEILRSLFDRLFSFFSILLLLPILLVLAILLRRDSRGPIFYRGDRVGRHGKPFKILKFRTMFEDPSSYDGPRITAQGDQRITPFGQWLRDTKLNELPQLWNVLKGDMSLVGPRPEDPEIIGQWPPEQRDILLSVRPGITSPASIAYRDEEAQLSSENVLDDYLREVLPTKLRLDCLYVRNRTLLSDLDVLFTTLYVLIPRARQVPVPEQRLYWGPFSFFFHRLAYWFAADFLVALISVSLVGLIWRSIAPLDIGWNWAPLIALLFAAVFSITNYFFDVHQIYWRKASPREALNLAFSSAVAVAVLYALDTYAFLAVDVPDGLFMVAGLLATFGFVTTRYRERILTGLAWRWLELRKGGVIVGEPVLIVGAGSLGEFAAWLVRKSDLAKAFTILGMVDDDPTKQKLHFDGIRVLGTTRDIPELVHRHGPGLILFAISNIETSEQQRILQLCEQTGVRTVMVPNIIEMMKNYVHQGSLISDSDTHAHGRPRVKAGQVAGWLAEIERLLQDGRVEAARAQIEQYKESLRQGPE